MADPAAPAVDQQGAATAVDQQVVAIDWGIHLLHCAMNPRAIARLAREGLPLPPHYNAVPLLYAISNGSYAPESDGEGEPYGGGEGGGCAEVTVGGVADRLCLDPSRASRMVTAAIAAGHVTRLASQADGRRTVLALTPAGRAVIADAERFRHARYDRVMADWSAEERAEFARLLTRFVERL